MRRETCVGAGFGPWARWEELQGLWLAPGFPSSGHVDPLGARNQYTALNSVLHRPSGGYEISQVAYLPTKRPSSAAAGRPESTSGNQQTTGKVIETK